jgi:uncharacterized protein (TIGR03435 family)
MIFVSKNMKLCLVLLASALLNAQSPPKRPEFEVASIKPTPPGGEGSFIGTKGPGRFDAENTPIRALIAEAYGVKTFEIYGAPGWLASDKYDISAKAEAGPGAKLSADALRADLRLRLQTLLEDRCALKVHRETKELPVYALTIAKGGVKVKPPNCVTFDINNRPPPPAPGEPRPAFCGNMGGRRDGVNSTLNATGIAMKDLTRWLSNTTSRTVIDKTGYTETFNLSLEWTPDGALRPAPSDDPAKPAASPDTVGPSIFTALQEQLGLKLESTKGPVEVLVIDHVEKPSAN